MSVRRGLARDGDIRPVVREWISQQPLWRGAVLREELGLCNGEARADVAVIGAQLAGFEIKGPLDRLDRLPRQVAFYDRIFAQCWLVTTEAGWPAASALISPWWGVLLAEGGRRPSALSLMRAAQPNPTLEPVALARLLWRHEVLAELGAMGRTGATRRLPRHRLWQILAEALPVEELAARVAQVVGARQRPAPASSADAPSE
ncbi:sce7726 family protein [Streptomyces sp. NPDC051172]|uniref:sce7726 family protein n=1 Tax=Streptomyces sp. NPDC051172 TaxID=3155796 RepID=UPI00342773B2